MRTRPAPVLRRYRLRKLRAKRTLYTLSGVFTCLLLAIGLYFIPPIHERLSWRLRDMWTNVRFFFNPPEEAFFLPTQQSHVASMVTQTLSAAFNQTATKTLLPDGPITTPTITPTPLPSSYSLFVQTYVDQCYRWNYCGPANLAMALNYWGWGGNRDDVAVVVKPGVQDPNLEFYQQGETDKNVTVPEMVNFVNQNTSLQALYRVGGEMNVLKNLLIHGYPIVIEKGYYTYTSDGAYEWVGHYAFITGYDDSLGGMLWQDTYPNSCPEGATAMEREAWGRDNLTTYDELVTNWRVFNYIFIVIFPGERENDVLALLGPWADENWAAQHALEIAEANIPTLSADDLFFAWFSKGSSLVALTKYQEAAVSYDTAFQIYASLGSDTIDKPIPYRTMWYQDGPYLAYYNTARYQDVINLANFALSTVRGAPTLEESLYWRALAEYELGETEQAIADMREVIRLKYNFQPAIDQLQEWLNDT